MKQLCDPNPYTGLVPLLNQLLRDPEPCVQKEAAWAVANATQGSQAQVQCFVEASCLDSLCNLLAGRRDAAVLCVVLEASPVSIYLPLSSFRFHHDGWLAACSGPSMLPLHVFAGP